MTATETVDAVVIGANIRGLVTTYVLGSLGCRVVLLDRGHALGGVDGSFVTQSGARFDHGLHVVDSMRSALTTRLFTHVVDGAVHRVTLRRGIVIRNHLMPYAPRPDEMPDDLRRMLPSDELDDDIGDALPTRERLERCYGAEFATMVFEEIGPSYRCEFRHREFGVDPARLLTNVYPWMFPRARRRPSADESRRFHDRLREGIPQQILYPRAGGFGGFADGFVRKFAAMDVETILGTEVALAADPGTHRADGVAAGDRRFVAPHYFWAASWPALCRLLDVPCQEVATDRVLLGSFRLDRPAHTDYHEILVGDLSHHLNRVNFPARFRESSDPLVQVEFAVPRAEEWPLTEEHWREVWVGDLRRLGVLDADHRVVEFDFRQFCMHYNAFGMEGIPLEDADPTRLHPDTNIRPVVPSMANLNLNAHVPRTVRYVTSLVTV